MLCNVSNIGCMYFVHRIYNEKLFRNHLALCSGVNCFERLLPQKTTKLDRPRVIVAGQSFTEITCIWEPYFYTQWDSLSRQFSL